METLVYWGVRLNRSVGRIVTMSTKTNLINRGFGCSVGMDIPDDDVDDEHIGIGGFK